MRFRATLATVMMVSGLAAAEARHVCVAAIGRSAHSFCQYFQALQKEPLNPVERLVFSLALTRAQARQECKAPLRS